VTTKPHCVDSFYPICVPCKKHALKLGRYSRKYWLRYEVQGSYCSQSVPVAEISGRYFQAKKAPRDAGLRGRDAGLSIVAAEGAE
jgi:hypothetical protein